MSVIVTARVRDEAHNVDRFCSAYSWADRILLADGGSVDDTKELASRYPNVEIRDFTERIEMRKGLWRNPHGKHINFVIKWAESYSPTWIIFDDFDSVVNNNRMEDLFSRDSFIRDYDYIMMTRLYLWKDGTYFPKMSQDKGGKWTHALWAWKLEKELRYKENNPLLQEYVHVPDENYVKINPEFSCLMHYSWVDEDRLSKKLEFYRKSGQHPSALHPLDYAGKPEELPEWVI